MKANYYLTCITALMIATNARPDETVIERGPHHSVIQSTETIELDGEVVEFLHTYTQLGTGLNYWSPNDNAWVPSNEIIEFVNSKTVYRQGQYKLIFASNINDINGNLEWFPTENERIVIQTIGIAMREEETGNSVWLGQLKDTQGFLTAQNEVVWPSCFDDIDASVRVTVRSYGFENDVVLHERPPENLFQGTSRLEIWHQVISGPEPAVRPATIRRSNTKTDPDAWLQFNEMLIGPGTAFLVGTNAERLSSVPGQSIPVAKQYWTDGETGMRFLVESIPIAAARDHLSTLPPNRNAAHTRKSSRKKMIADYASKIEQRRATALTESKREVLKIASISSASLSKRAGLLMDFQSLVSQSNVVLAGHTTYCVASNSIVSLDGNTIVEPNCVIKFGQTDPGGSTPGIKILGTLDCRTKPYAPAIFTSREDRTVGETNTALTASIDTNNTYGAYHLMFVGTNGNAFSLHDLRSRYSNNALQFDGTNVVDLQNIQFFGTANKCIQTSSSSNYFRNILAHGVNNVVVAGANNASVRGEHFTIHAASKTFSDAGLTGCTFNLINSLIVVATNTSSSGLMTMNSAIVNPDPGVFQTVGSGAHYLADDSPYRNAGTTAISTNLTQGFFTYGTTFPPIVLSGTFNSDTVLGPQAARDIDSPDLGYHYAALDFALGGVGIANNVSLTLTNGVAIGFYGYDCVATGSGSRFISEGQPTKLNHLARYNLVQEQPTAWGTAVSNQTSRMVVLGSGTSELRMRFSEVSMPAYSLGSTRSFFAEQSSSSMPSTYSLQDCEFYSAKLTLNQGASGASPSVNLINNVFHRSSLSISVTSGFTMTTTMNNNYFRCGEITYAPTASGSNLRDNLFESSSASVPNAQQSYANNAFFLMTSFGFNPKTVSMLDFQSGAQGNWYYPTSGSGLFTLVNAGSQTVAGAGLFHYTTRTDHVKDTGNVDIGFHYASIDATGAVDTDSDGIPDYSEDVNGNGTVGSSESNFAVNVKIFSPSAADSLP